MPCRSPKFALEPSFINFGVLKNLVVVRTFLSWTLVLEIEGRWPWQGEQLHAADALSIGMTGRQAYAPRREGANIGT
jgi:hypothetical protein